MTRDAPPVLRTGDIVDDLRPLLVGFDQATHVVVAVGGPDGPIGGFRPRPAHPIQLILSEAARGNF